MELKYEIILSRGKGFFTPKAQKLLLILINNYMERKDIWQNKQDCIQHAALDVFRIETLYTYDRTQNAFSYYTEITKRAVYKYVNLWINEKENATWKRKNISIESLAL